MNINKLLNWGYEIAGILWVISFITWREMKNNGQTVFGVWVFWITILIGLLIVTISIFIKDYQDPKKKEINEKRRKILRIYKWAGIILLLFILYLYITS